MTHSATIDITFREQLPSIEAAINILLQVGWRVDGFFPHGIKYLPVGDNDSYRWQIEEPQNWPKVLEVIAQKERRNERIGITLTLDDTQGDFFFQSDYYALGILINNVGRKCLEDSRFTDFTWYNQRIVLPLSRKYSIAGVECDDIP